MSAHTNGERFFAVIMIMVGAALFAAIVGKMSALTQLINANQNVRGIRGAACLAADLQFVHHLHTHTHSQVFAQRWNQINYYLKVRRIPKHLRQRTRAYYDYIRYHTATAHRHASTCVSPSHATQPSVSIPE